MHLCVALANTFPWGGKKKKSTLFSINLSFACKEKGLETSGAIQLISMEKHYIQTENLILQTLHVR